MLGFLGLLNSTTMEKRSFHNIEEAISPTTQEVSKDIFSENLKAAVMAVAMMMATVLSTTTSTTIVGAQRLSVRKQS